MRDRVSIFNKSRNIDIKDSSLTVNVDTSKFVLGGNLDPLLDQVALNAILNAGGRADEVRCYPGTREEVIRKIERWMDRQGKTCHRMMWLSGPAGAGKSAIAQTVAERRKNGGIHGANFFFFRGDATRNHAQPLVATLVYQLLDFYPSLRKRLIGCLTENPLIYKASAEEQFVQLISSPIQVIRQPSSIHRPIILIIDGLDECDNQGQQEKILRALSALVEEENSPFRVLVASRAEPQLVTSFNRIRTSVESIFLNDEYRPEGDIRRFVIAKFGEIKRVHHLAHTLDNDWPAQADIDAITDKSSGQFIYAATVMRFIEYSTASPALSFLIVHGIRPSAGHSPLAQLDAVYSYIFSKAHDIKAVKLCLGAHFIIQSGPISDITNGKILFGTLLRDMAMIEMESSFADLAAIVKVVDVQRVELLFYHASLSDYLKDKSRSGIYCIDEEELAVELSLIGLKNFGDPGGAYRKGRVTTVASRAWPSRPSTASRKS